MNPRGLGGDSVLMSITIQFIREGTRTPFGIYNNIGGWGGESPRTLPHNIVLGPHCPKRGWSNSLLEKKAGLIESLKVMRKICTNFGPTLRLFLTRTGQVIKLGTNSATYLGIVLFLLLAFGEFFVLILGFCSSEFLNVFPKGNCLKRILELST